MMKQGKTILKDSKNGFPPTVEVGSDDQAVSVFIGPVWVRLAAVDAGNSYDVRVSIHGKVNDRPAESSFRTELIVEAAPDAVKDWQRGNRVSPEMEGR